MLGKFLHDPSGSAGDLGTLPGLDLLPVETTFAEKKEVSQVAAEWRGERWNAYEIHMGVSKSTQPCEPLLRVKNGSGTRAEGCRQGKIWGTYLHGFFESTAVRQELAQEAGIVNYQPSTVAWSAHLQSVYEGMAALLDEHLDLREVWRYVEG